MTHSIESVSFICGALLFISALASRISSSFGIPSLILFIVVGMLAGSDGLGGIQFEDNLLGRELGTAALALILFSGGLDTHWRSIKPIIRPGLALATIGTALTACLIGLFAHKLLGLTLLEGLLLGAVVSPTDAAAVFGILRAKSMRLKNDLGPLLELESGSNDPTSVFLTVALTSLVLNPNQQIWPLAGDFIIQMGIGGLFGYCLGRSAAWLINRIHLDFDGLYTSLTLSLAFISFGGATLIGGNGFLAVYIAGVSLGNRNFIHRTSLLQFHDGLAWLMQIAMFLTLGLLVFPSQLPAVILSGTALALFLIFIARPIAVFMSLSLCRKFSMADMAFLSWMGLRGAVPIILATIPLTAGVQNAHGLFNVVFFVVLFSVLLQGTTTAWLAKKLNVALPAEDNMIERQVVSNKLEVTITAASPAVGKHVVELGLPPSALIVLLTRGQASLIPRGNTKIEAGDVLLISSPPGDEQQLRSVLLGPTV